MLAIGVILLVRSLAPSFLSGMVAVGLGALLVFGSLGWLLFDGVENRWVSDTNQWAEQGVRTSLAAARQVVDASDDRPIVLLVNFGDKDEQFDHQHRVRVGQDLHERVPDGASR